MRLYICGPMTGLPEHNYPAFAAATGALVDAGYDVSSPHEIVITKPHGDRRKTVAWKLALAEKREESPA